MKTLHSLQDLSVTPDMVLHEAENKLFDAFQRKRIRTVYQLRHFVAGIPGALGQALKKSETYAVIGILMRGTWVPRSWT